MKGNYSSKKASGYLLAVFLLFGTAIISSTTAQAQYPGWGQDRQDRNDRYRRDRDRDDRYGRNNGYGYNTYQIAQQQGYSDGLSTGSADAQRGQSFDPQRSHYYRNANDGYNSRYGNRGQYQQAFRQGFLQGYREGYQRYGYGRGRNNGRRTYGGWFPW